MNTSQIKYVGQLRTKAIHIKSNNTIITDAPTDNKGKGEAFSPTDLVATALASCMMTIIGIKANERSIDVTDMSTDVTKIMTSNPRKIKEIIVDFSFPNKNYTSKEKVMIERAAKTCPVALSLNEDIKQTLNFSF
jgi:putative redox protein